MADPYVGEIRIFGGNFAPRGWALCDGSVLPIGQYEVLSTLIGTTYGGDGVQTFALPDLRGRAPIHQGGAHAPGERGGSETVTLSTAQIPSHPHPLAATTNIADQLSPANNILAQSSRVTMYIDQGESSDVRLKASLSPAGGGVAHENRQPFLCLSYIIALDGVYPLQS